MPLSECRLPEDLRTLATSELLSLAQELRYRIIEISLKNGGHIGASLGTVELAIALHRCLDSPDEPIFWDVGHQAYAHKLLTGRWDAMEFLRKKGGPSGFLSRWESPHDVFGAGHAGTAVSSALAAAWCRRGTSRWTAAVVGDGALTCGLTLEALNQAAALETGPLVVLLNDNQLSISPNVGSFPRLLRSSDAAHVFNALGWDYIGPEDGHDLPGLIGRIESLKSMAQPGQRPVLLHVITEKGKGYAPAEANPAKYHGVSALKPSSKAGPSPVSWSDVVGEVLVNAAEHDPHVVAISAAMTEGTGLSRFQDRYPERTFDVGIAEGHAVTFAAGLAAQGKKPVVAIYSTFLQRAFDSVIHDVAIQRLPVVFAVDRAGLVGADGPTHHGAFDIAYLSMVPDLELWAPADEGALRGILSSSLQRSVGGPIAIRYPRGAALQLPESLRAWVAAPAFSFQRSESPNGGVVVAVGPTWMRAKAALEMMGAEAAGVELWCAQRLDQPEALWKELSSAPWVLTLEDGVVGGGFGERLGAALHQRGYLGRLKALGFPHAFVEHGEVNELEALLRLDPVGISEAIRKLQG